LDIWTIFFCCAGLNYYDELKYIHDTATFDTSIYSPYADALKGGETETKIAYLVKGHPEYATFSV
jgi:hypothetical protein